MSSSNSQVDLAHLPLVRQLKRLREEQRLTKADLAEKSGLTYRTIHDLEEGRRPRIQRTTLLALAEALGVEPELLLRESNPDTQPHPSRPFASPKILRGMVLVILVVSALFALRHYAVSNARWTVENQTIVGYDKVFGSILWKYQAIDQINNVTIAPWSESELLLGIHNLRGQHGSILCLDRSNGKIRWSQLLDITKPMSAFGDSLVLDARFRCNLVAPTDLDGDGESEIVAGFVHGLWYPYSLCHINRDGELLHQYDCKGHLRKFFSHDLDNDGKDELLGYGVNNTKSYMGATIYCWSEDFFSGAGVDPLANPESAASDHAKYRTVFPMFPEEIQKLTHDIRLVSTDLEVVSTENGTTQLRLEVGRHPSERMTIVLDSQLHPLSVEVSDLFQSTMSAWPDSITEGPFDEAWLSDWLDQHYCFQDGVMVHGDSVQATIPRYSK